MAAEKCFLVNGDKVYDEWECQWPKTNNYKIVLRNRNLSRLVNLKSLLDIIEFVERFSVLNNVNFTVCQTRKNKDGTLYRLYKCHHGADRLKGNKVTNTK